MNKFRINNIANLFVSKNLENAQNREQIIKTRLGQLNISVLTSPEKRNFIKNFKFSDYFNFEKKVGNYYFYKIK